MVPLNDSDDGAVLVEVDDPVVRSLLPDYIARRRESLAELDELLGRDDFESIRLIGHNIRGSGGAYGIERLSEIGKRLEKAACDSNSADAAEAIADMRVLLGRLVVKS